MACSAKAPILLALLVALTACGPAYRLQVTSPAAAEPALDITLVGRDGRAVLPGIVVVRACRLPHPGAAPEVMPEVYWAVTGKFNEPPALSVLHVRYGVTPAGWRADEDARPLPADSCVFIVSMPRWGHGVAQLAIQLDSTQQSRVIWRSPPYVTW